MKALSIRQPWAWAIVHAGKDIENRSRTLKYRGPVLIHAAKRIAVQEYREFVANLEEAERLAGNLEVPDEAKLHLGGIIGRAEIIDCVSEHSSPWFMGPFGFVLANPEPLPFRPYRGQLGLFEVTL